MAFFDIRALNGAVVHVSGQGVVRLTISHPNEHGTRVTHVDLTDGPLLTSTPMGSVAAAAISAGAKLVELTVADASAKVWLSVTAFNLVQPVDDFLDPHGARCVLRGPGSLRQAVHETQEMVAAAIGNVMNSV